VQQKPFVTLTPKIFTLWPFAVKVYSVL
jgi:hypothetical protein